MVKLEDNIAHERTVDKGSSRQVWGIFKRASDRLDAFGVETRGIERIEPYERSTNKTKQLISVIGLWISASGGLSSMSSFYLGALLFGLGLKKTLTAGLIGHILGCAIAAYCSLMGPRSGCRQMVGARFLFGWWAVKFVSLVSIIGVVGWSIVNSVVGGQILQAVSNGKIPLVGGIILIAGISLAVSIGGIKHLLRVEAFLSIPVSIAFLLLYVVASQKFGYLSNADAEGVDSSIAKGNWLSFFSLCYSITSTWGSIASDYYILFPENTPDIKVFCITFFGILIPTSFVGIVALLIGNVAMSYQPWNDAFATNGMGGLLHEVFTPWGAGGKFLLVLIFLSLISNNIINTYSAAFGIQLAGSALAKVPRWIWAIIVTVFYLICALVGRHHFAVILENFLPMVGYWISMYFIILFEENTIFRTKMFIHLYTKEFEHTSIELKQRDFVRFGTRKSQNYNFAIWNDINKLTRGLAATTAFVVGCTGAAIGMSQTYWVGPVAKACGGDVAMWLCMGISGVVYPGLRYLELKKFGR